MKSNFAICNPKSGIRIPKSTTGHFILLLLTVACLSGCGVPDYNAVWLTRLNPQFDGPTRFNWSAARIAFTENNRGQYELVAESAPDRSDKPVRQWLFVHMLWDISPTHTGTDESAVNAQIGYLVQADPDSPGGKTLYYEGVGNVYVDQPQWLGGKVRFLVRHNVLKLAKADRERAVDPFGRIRVDAELLAGVDPEAGQAIDQFKATIAKLRPPAEILLPAPPAPAPVAAPTTTSPEAMSDTALDSE